MTVRHKDVLGSWVSVAAEDLVLGAGRRLCRGTGWHCWTHGEGWVGAAMTGAVPPGEADRSMTHWCTVNDSARAPFKMVCDVSRLSGPIGDITSSAAEVGRLITALQQTFSPHLQRMHMVVPRQWWDNWWFGAYAPHAENLRTTFFTERDAAWHASGAPSEVRTDVDQLFEALSLREGLLPSVERQVRDDPGASAVSVAKALGLSARSLQRALAELGETFVGVRGRIRMEVADLLLAEGMLVKQVGTRVGFASTSHFVAWYRAQRGTTPGIARP